MRVRNRNECSILQVVKHKTVVDSKQSNGHNMIIDNNSKSTTNNLLTNKKDTGWLIGFYVVASRVI